ncbi:disulfide bond formation protein B [Shewanella algidipiscicola]|uniref:disulfide bond formation protein B n=1 Tax=Shewanella algidipiscicola TaxID=614070 RepID=UPI000D788499|nr:disulfide bond formation protein B [Shewanella algidipiscicola]
MKEHTFNKLASFASIIIMALPVGIACFFFGFILLDNPCAFCWQERTAMILVSLTALYIVRFGIKPKYIAALVWLGIYGAFMALLHTSINLGSDIGQGFSLKIMGAHTYTWALLVFVIVLVVVALLMLTLGNKFPDNAYSKKPFDTLPKLASWVFIFVIAGNIVQAFTQTGPIPFVGQDSPGRVSFNPKFISWELDHWPTYAPNARGAYGISDPDIEQWQPASPLFTAAPTAKLLSQASLPNTISGRVTAIDYQAEKQIYAITTSNNWVYILDHELKLLNQAQIDGMYMLHIEQLNGVAFTSTNTLMVMGFNKAWAELVLDPEQNWEINYRGFTQSSDGIGETARGQFSTIRAKTSYSLTLGYSKMLDQYITVTTRDELNETLVVSRFDKEDTTLSAEANLKGLTGMALPKLTGISIDGEQAWLLNNDASEVLQFNLTTGEVSAMTQLVGTTNPQGLLVHDGQLLTVSCVNGQNLLQTFVM